MTSLPPSYWADQIRADLKRRREVAETCADHDDCCPYLLCAHPKCCGYAGRSSAAPKETR